MRTSLIMARQEFVINVTELMGNVVFMVRVPRHGSFAIKVSRLDKMLERTRPECPRVAKK